MSNKKNKDDNALIYSGIKNYINSENFSAYQYLLESISNTGKVSQEGLDDILSNTVIKKACCKQNENEEDNNYYETDVLLPSNKDTQGRTVPQTILVNKSYCEPNYSQGAIGCLQFEPLYCENSKLLYDKSFTDTSMDNPWNIQIPWCTNHKSLIEEKVEKEAQRIQDEREAATKKQNQAVIDNIMKNVNRNTPDTASLLRNSRSSNAKSKSTSGSTSGSTSESSSNTIYFVIGGVICLILIIIVIIIIVMNKKKNEESDN